MATSFRLCDEDRERWGGPEWVTFDENDLDDCDSVILSEYEASMGVQFAALYLYDVPRNTIRWQAAQVWLARRLAGVDTPDLVDFRIKIRKVERKDVPAGDDAVPPDSSSPSTAKKASKKA